jgi:homocysteine S-methyltransferase
MKDEVGGLDPIAAILARYPAMVLDGAMATELERRGCDLNDPLWSARVLVERPELIRAVHADYFAAGADCAITASYQATFEGFAGRGIGADKAAELMRRSVRLAAEARDAFWADPANRAGRPRPLVAASVGPYGAMLHDGSEYRGDYGLGVEALMAFHRPRLAVLARAGADLLACETIPCREEAEALLRLLDELPGVYAWFSFTARDEARISHGEPIGAVAALLGRHPRVAAVGVNCTPPHLITPLVRAIRGATDKPIVVYPNSGELYDAATGRWSAAGECEPFGRAARAWHAAGARIVGGCCRTGPAEIAEVAALLTSRRPLPPAASTPGPGTGAGR